MENSAWDLLQSLVLNTSLYKNSISTKINKDQRILCRCAKLQLGNSVKSKSGERDKRIKSLQGIMKKLKDTRLEVKRHSEPQQKKDNRGEHELRQYCKYIYKRPEKIGKQLGKVTKLLNNFLHIN